jgi:prevent-host-death family protein
MSTTQIEVNELQNRFSEIISRAKAGEEIIVTEANIPRAKLIPIEPDLVRKLGLHPGGFQMADDFDAPLPEEFWLGQS